MPAGPVTSGSVVGAGTYAHAAGQYRATENNFSALDVLMASGEPAFECRAHVPAVSGEQAKRRGATRYAARLRWHPIWEGVTLIPDEITKAANGQIVITAIMLYAVKILRGRAVSTNKQTQHA